MNFKVVGVALILEIALSSCARYTNYGPSRLLVFDEYQITNDKRVAFLNAATACGFNDIKNFERPSSASIIYMTACSRSCNVQIGLQDNFRAGKLFIVEGEEDRNDNDGFTETTKSLFACFESELSKSLPNSFEIVQVPAQPH